MTPTQLRYDRLDLELYGDRLARHPARLTEEISAARLRLASYSLEREAHRELGATRSWAHDSRELGECRLRALLWPEALPRRFELVEVPEGVG
jgi:hypothetical protein